MIKLINKDCDCFSANGPRMADSARPWWCNEGWNLCPLHQEYGNIVHAINLDLDRHHKVSHYQAGDWDWQAALQ